MKRVNLTAGSVTMTKTRKIGLVEPAGKKNESAKRPINEYITTAST